MYTWKNNNNNNDNDDDVEEKSYLSSYCSLFAFVYDTCVLVCVSFGRGDARSVKCMNCSPFYLSFFLAFVRECVRACEPIYVYLHSFDLYMVFIFVSPSFYFSVIYFFCVIVDILNGYCLLPKARKLYFVCSMTKSFDLFLSPTFF